MPTFGKILSLSFQGKIFGVPVRALPHSVVPEYGNIPSFLVDACTSLEAHIHTEGLFRKSGSVTRLKALKSKVDHGDEGGLSSALPCDVAGLLKQFFRELPEPILPADLHEALFRAQQLGTEEKSKATLLLSCLMTDHTVDILRYFFSFLRNVSLRASENKMDSSNLAVIFAPNLLQTNEGHEKMSANMEKKLRLQAAVVQTLIDFAPDIGRVPDFILEKMPAMLGIDGLCATPLLEGFEEGECETPGECKRKRRQSVGDFVNGALNKLKYNRTPSITPQQDRTVHFDTSPEGSSQSSISPVAMSGNGLMSTDVLRRSKRIANKRLCRVESGKAGCFSPKINRKEKVRRSLRLKFSLGKSSRDANGCSGVNRSEHVGRRLANQPSLKTRIESVKTGLLFSPDIGERLSKKGPKKISKSEENLLTPEQMDGTSYRMSWTGPSNLSFQMDVNEASPTMGNPEVENFPLEPSVMIEKLPALSCELRPSALQGRPVGSALASSLSGDENSVTSETVVKIQRAFSESGSHLHALISHRRSSVTAEEEVKLTEPLYIESSPEKSLCEADDETVRESEEKYGNGSGKDKHYSSEVDGLPHQSETLGKEATGGWYSAQMRVEDELHSDIPKDHVSQQLPSHEQVPEQQSPGNGQTTEVKDSENKSEDKKSAASSPAEAQSSSSQQSVCEGLGQSKPKPVGPAKQRAPVESCDGTVCELLQMTEPGKVSDHIQWFNKLSLNEPNRTKVKSPLKFQRTPVRQSVRRINSLLEYNRQPGRQKLVIPWDAASPLVKSVSCDSALPCHTGGVSAETSASDTRSAPQDPRASSCEWSGIDGISKSSTGLPSRSFSKLRRHPESVNATLQPRVFKQEVVSDGQIKIPLDDLTNHDILRSGVNNKGFPSGIKTRVLRKPSERERVWYKGSPKHPIGKAQLLPTSRPVDL
ncbi:PREDICTED: rho GTPase-activating protein 11A isoform X2 [Dipodomys ordii]|uniref:Rho GTPase-activating protein 11A isoform X2 n=1 Tax=Dipodomys ordii TaxID=10020 RepID=A0A1S3EMK5_DIPOR|nr:PREDICTED: rho GTPase-activating protein 11A isoform X2 [Dipodomys ordii]